MPIVDMLWSGWGDPERAERLPESVTGLLRELLGVHDEPAQPVKLAEIEPPAARPVPLADIVGEENVRTDDETRVRHTRGKSTADLLRIRAGDVRTAPDAVVLPGSHDEVAAVLARCAENRIAVVPFGGGTSVVGGLTPEAGAFAGVVALDLRRLDRLVGVDTVSRTATLQPGLRAPRAEELLNEQGYTLGHFPQSFEWASIGGFAAARSSGQASAGYGRFDEMVLALTLATPSGTIEAGRSPRSAAGPDLRQLVLGSEGAFGVITEVTVRIRPLPETQAYEGWLFRSLSEGVTALRALAQDGPLPTVLRLSDETETMIGLARPEELGQSGGTGGCLAVCGYDGTAAEVAERRARVRTRLESLGGEYQGEEPGESWARGRFAAPYLRDALLDAGVLAETLETAAFWSNLSRLYDAVRLTLSRELSSSVVMCHVSHVYPAGASLYFTVVTAQGEEPLESWGRAKTAVGDAIVEAGGTITHHHGVGVDHRDQYAREAGPLGVAALRAVKDRLDPAGVMNPGILIPPA
ncbi:FAD-binding oxidoreductase [Actinomadura sp. DC4]|uniref:FAD-binding oxidoreductase n=1 Tax=Actinomadura sp. DC4 TaxID=3055069 RepID=UPI0025AFC584|nr:FAD-binding oxidoreductase [Actinomadura sp. DC4]MDN3355184.1 FAD-binding oxidoreductase [Actinomadura sp. DC4]